MSNILSILNQLSSSPKSTEKLSILKANSSNEVLKAVFYNALNPRFQYYIKQKTFPHVESFYGMFTLEGEVDRLLPLLRDRVVTGNEAIETVRVALNQMTEDDAEVMKRIILKDLKCGVNERTVNKVWKDLIPTTPYMRCSGDEKLKNIKYPAIVQRKEDGSFCNVIVDNGKVSFLTRNGSSFFVNNIAKELEGMTGSFVLIGEMLITNDTGVEVRKRGNGKLNMLIKNMDVLDNYNEKLERATTATQLSKLRVEVNKYIAEIADIDSRTIINVWDVVPLEDWNAGACTEQYAERFKRATQLAESINNDIINVVPSKIVENEVEALAYAKVMIAQGKEGAVLKNLSATFKDGTSTDQVKLKAVLDADLICRGWYSGKVGTEFENGIGGFYMETSCSMLKVNVGSGLSREQRGLEMIDKNDISKGLKVIDGFDFNQYNDKIMTIEYNELIQAEGREEHSMFLPIFVEVRYDKTEADSLERLQTMQSLKYLCKEI
jgi:ATP-dependent DNA ligase